MRPEVAVPVDDRLTQPPATPRRQPAALRRDTAATVLSRPQQAFIAALLLGLAAEALWFGWHSALVTLVAACEAFYFAFVGFKMLTAVASFLPTRGGRGDLPSASDPDLPTFTIFLPNVKEKPHVLRGLLKSMATLDYPADKLQVMLLVEHWDTETLRLFGADGSGVRADGERIRLAPNVEVCAAIPGAPGRPSEGSPRRAMKSGTSSGPMP